MKETTRGGESYDWLRISGDIAPKPLGHHRLPDEGRVRLVKNPADVRDVAILQKSLDFRAFVC